ncbi:MAG TPA: hypothetical protein VKP65_18645 [Rhodothermales bacterium]|nr:hypothetical protein [Rhodothermales bacterium]
MFFVSYGPQNQLLQADAVLYRLASFSVSAYFATIHGCIARRG